MFNILCVLLFMGWEIQNSGTNERLLGIYFVDSLNGWAVGENGTILKTTNGGNLWEIQVSPTSRTLFSVFFWNQMIGWVVGDSGIILNTVDGGANWSFQSSPTVNELHDVYFINQNRGWAVGATGTIIGTTDGGTTWNNEISGEFPWLWGVTAESESLAWVIGADWFNGNAPIYYYDGSSWMRQFDIPSTADGHSISSVNSSTVWAVGGDGTIYHTTDGGTSWLAQVSGTNEFLFDISAVSPSSSWIVGSSGIILHTSDSGNTWLSQTSPVTDTLFSIFMLDTLKGWIGGDNGIILHTTDGGLNIEELSYPFSRISIYPDIVGSELNFMLNDFSNTRISIQLFDISGRLRYILYKGPSKKEFCFPLPFLPPGSYILIISNHGEKISFHFLKI